MTGFAAPQRWQRAERAPVLRAADDDVVARCGMRAAGKVERRPGHAVDQLLGVRRGETGPLHRLALHFGAAPQFTVKVPARALAEEVWRVPVVPELGGLLPAHAIGAVMADAGDQVQVDEHATELLQPLGLAPFWLAQGPAVPHADLDRQELNGRKNEVSACFHLGAGLVRQRAEAVRV